MNHVGDITKLRGCELNPVDVVTGGSPCQDLSVAGKREGLSGERSGLFMEQIRVIKELRAADEQRGYTNQFIRPRFMVWENVPGAFSSNRGEDFGAVLHETIKIVCPQAPAIPVPKNGWPTSGSLTDMGGGWSIAWRVLDAQFWGVPQRRRRIALVADFGGRSAPEILFIRNSLQRNTTPSGTPRQTASGAAPRGVAIPILTGGLTESLTLPIHDKATRYKGGGDTRSNDGAANGLGIGKPGNPCPTLDTCSKHAVLVAESENSIDKCLTPWESQRRRIHHTEGISPTLDGSDGGGGRNPGGLFLTAGFNGDEVIVPVITYRQKKFYDYAQGVGTITANPSRGSTSETLAVHQNASGELRLGGVANTLSTNGNPSGRNAPLIMASGQINAEILADISPTLNCNHEQPIVTGIDCRNGTENFELCATIQAKPGGGCSLNCTHPVRIGFRVRRLTPLECERLQGYPDGWTDIPDYIAAGKKRTASDSARYKALGNSIAQPPWKWVLKRIAAQYERDATLGSLFDGIGGFPLIWEQINGIGSAIWASEVEPFCIAVTEYRFNCGEV